MNAHPRNRLVIREALAHGGENGGLIEKLGMAGHADLGGRYARPARRLDAEMAVAAIEAIEADVMFVAEGNGLRANHVLPGHIGRPGDRETAAIRSAGLAASASRATRRAVSA